MDKNKGVGMGVLGLIVAASVWLGHVLPHSNVESQPHIHDEVTVAAAYESVTSGYSGNSCIIFDPADDPRLVRVSPLNNAQDEALVHVQTVTKDNNDPKTIKCSAGQVTWKIIRPYVPDYWFAIKTD